MLVDGFDDIGVGVEALAVVLPEVPRGQQQAAVLWEQIPQLPEARQQVCHLQANLLQAPHPRAGRQTRGCGQMLNVGAAVVCARKGQRPKQPLGFCSTAFKDTEKRLLTLT